MRVTEVNPKIGLMHHAQENEKLTNYRRPLNRAGNSAAPTSTANFPASPSRLVILTKRRPATPEEGPVQVADSTAAPGESIAPSARQSAVLDCITTFDDNAEMAGVIPSFNSPGNS
jgi:hypothetical protein